MRFGSYTDHSVRIAVDLVNTRDGADEELVDERAVAAFLRSHQVRHHGRLRAEDVASVRHVRERLRDVFEAAHERTATAILNDILSDVDAHPYLATHDGEPWHLHYAPTEAPVARHVAATAAMGLAMLISDDGFERLGTCAWETCHDVFVDTSKNRSRRYCDPAVCGNRASAAAYRERRRSASPDNPSEI